MDEYLASIYFDPKHPASFAGPTKLYRAVKAEKKKITLKQIREWLKGQESYTLHRQVRHKFPRNRVAVYGIDEKWDVKLMDVTSLSKYNGGVRFILVAIDIFSRYTWLEPLKSKQGTEVLSAFKKIFNKGRVPQKIRTDRGKEFTNHAVDTYLKEKNIIHFVTNNEVKANYAERVLKTIKSKFFRYFTKMQSYKYIDHIQDFVDSYNNTYHRSIKMKPADVKKENEAALWEQQYGMCPRPNMQVKFKFSVGDKVRMSYLRRTFMREYEEKWTDELFLVVKRFIRDGLPIYKLKDYQDENVEGTFYQYELQQVKEPEIYRIEKVLKTRKVKGKKQYFIRWAGWPSKYDIWIDEGMLEGYK